VVRFRALGAIVEGDLRCKAHPLFFVSVAFKRVRNFISLLESTLMGIPASVAFKELRGKHNSSRLDPFDGPRDSQNHADPGVRRQKSGL
jgi:hypothetical protein